MHKTASPETMPMPAAAPFERPADGDDAALAVGVAVASEPEDKLIVAADAGQAGIVRHPEIG
ncbi:hypothetical protein MMC30_006797 [Trapelia coarctata]|nr:hypothetical protein [Trapelia coarctata]